MDVLLDTHSFLWFVDGDVSLSIDARQAIADPQNRVFVSTASLWEITIKLSLNKLKISIPPEQLFEQVEANGFILLPIAPQHILKILSLPMHHRDPFDRLLLAQAITENMTIISKDEHMRAYTAALLW